MKVAGVWIALCVMCLTALAAPPQGIALLRQEWVGRNFYLRGFWAGEQITTNAAGMPGAPLHAGSWTLAEVHIRKIAEHRGAIVISGYRVVQVYQAASKGFEAEPWPEGKVSIRVEANPKTLTAADVQRLQQGLFLGGAAELAASLPPGWQPFAQRQRPSWQRLPPGGRRAVPSYTPDPKYTEAARELCVQGKDRMGVEINAQGTVDRVWVIRPLGAGLDERAMEALQTWQFTPAHDASGRAIPMTVQVGMNFHVHGLRCP